MIKRPESSCDHEWETVTVDNGDGIYFESHSYLECIHCREQKDIESEEPDAS